MSLLYNELLSLEWILFGLRILATVILYAFLGVAFYIIWRDLRQTQDQTATPQQPVDQLRVIAVTEGQPLVVGQTIPLQSVVFLGDGLKNTIVVNEADTVTKQARLTQTDGVWWLENLILQKELKLNGNPLSEPLPLSSGDIIEIAGVHLKLELATR